MTNDPAVDDAIEHARMLGRIAAAVIEDPAASLVPEFAELAVREACRLRMLAYDVAARRP